MPPYLLRMAQSLADARAAAARVRAPPRNHTLACPVQNRIGARSPEEASGGQGGTASGTWIGGSDVDDDF